MRGNLKGGKSSGRKFKKNRGSEMRKCLPWASVSVLGALMKL